MNDQRNGGIAWTDFTANPIKYRDANDRDVWACVKVSAGCANCYSATIAKRFERGTDYNANEMVQLTPYLDEKELNTLLKSTKISGKRVFIGDMTDIFGEWVSFDLLDRLFAVFALRPDVTFQILTKRPERMREYITAASECDDVTVAKFDITGEHWDFFASPRIEMPLPNVWLGVSVENQETADQRIPQLLDTPSAVRFVSYEPALGPVDFREYLPKMLQFMVGGQPAGKPTDGRNIINALARIAGTPEIEFNTLDWVIVGGESGPGARPCDVAWIRSTMAQCKAAGVPVFVKQLGSDPWDRSTNIGFAPGVAAQKYNIRTPKLKDRKGGDPSEWPEDLRVREFPEAQ